MSTFINNDELGEWENLRSEINDEWVSVDKGKKKSRAFNSNNSGTVPNIENNIQMISTPKPRIQRNPEDQPIVKMKRWAHSKQSVEKMIEFYNANKRNWEHPNFIQKNINVIFEELARAWRHDVIKELKRTNSNFRDSSTYLFKKRGPLHTGVWPDEEDAKAMTEDSVYQLKMTILTLVGMGFNMFEINKQYEDENETFIGALIADSNPIRIHKPEYANQLYEYFTESWSNFSSIQNLLNFILNNSFKNPARVNDKILYIIHKYQEPAIKKICEYIFAMQHSSTQGKKNENVIRVCESILLTPSESENYYRYLSKHNMNEIRENFIKSVIKNYIKWSDSFINDIKDIDNSEKEQYKYQCHSNIMIMFGVFYSKKICVNEIMTELEKYVDTDNKNVCKTILFLIENSNIDLKNMSDLENKFISEYLKKFFSATSSVNNRINIKNTFNKLLGYEENNTKDINEEINSFII